MALSSSQALQDGAAEARFSSEQPLEPWHYQVHGQETNQQGSLCPNQQRTASLKPPQGCVQNIEQMFS